MRKEVNWHWADKQQNSFDQLKTILSPPPVLCHYDPKLPIGIACDASQYGVGIIFFHTFPDGNERPIVYAAKTLNTAQRNYAQIEKEAYLIIVRIQKFRQFLYGQTFTLVTEHLSLLNLFAPNKPIPYRTSAHIQQWV